MKAKSRDSVRKPQGLKRKKSRSGLQPTSQAFLAFPLGQAGSRSLLVSMAL